MISVSKESNNLVQDLIDNFERRWNISCTDADIPDGENIVNCSIPSSTKGLATNVLCKYRDGQKAKYWECFNLANMPEMQEDGVRNLFGHHSDTEADNYNNDHKLISRGCAFI